MKTIRHNVFETNSSSEHCIVVSNERREASEFPPVNSDGVLDVEIKHYWDCGGNGVNTNNVAYIIEFLCALAVACSIKFPDSMKQVLSDIQTAYESFKLEPPKSLNIYIVDDHGKRIPYYDLINEDLDSVVVNADGNYECHFCSLNNFYEEMDENEFKEFYRLHQGYIDEKVVLVSHQAGLSEKLIWDDYRSTLEPLRPYGGSVMDCYDAIHLLTTKTGISFYHS